MSVSFQSTRARERTTPDPHPLARACGRSRRRCVGSVRGMTSASAMVTVKYRHVYEDVDRHGTVRLHFWRGRGHRKIRVREAPGSLPFAARYDEMLDASGPPEAAPDHKRGRSLVTQVLGAGCAPSTSARRPFAVLKQARRRPAGATTFDELIAPGALPTSWAVVALKFGPK
jgi:hypothetical protein